jgi:hypothetical protein
MNCRPLPTRSRGFGNCFGRARAGLFLIQDALVSQAEGGSRRGLRE